MGYDIDDQSEQFEEAELDVFGEDVEYSANGGAYQIIRAIVYRTQNEQPGLPRQSQTGRMKLEIKISQRSVAGIVTVKDGADKVRLKVLPSDAYSRVLTVSGVNAEYGAWRLGLA